MNKNILLIVALLGAGAVAGVFGARFLFKPAPVAGLSSPAQAPPVPIPSNLPPLEGSDAYAREKAAGLSGDLSFREWLEGDSVLQRLIAAINMTAHGRVPRDILAPFAPQGKFKVKTQAGKVVVDPAGYARYDKVAAFAVSVNALDAANAFTALLPLLDAAQRGLGEPNTSAKEALFTAVRELVAAPVPEGDVALKAGKKGIGWAYADERLENLSPAQKQLIRLGPKNQALIQVKLRAIVEALGAKF